MRFIFAYCPLSPDFDINLVFIFGVVNKFYTL